MFRNFAFCIIAVNLFFIPTLAQEIGSLNQNHTLQVEDLIISKNDLTNSLKIHYKKATKALIEEFNYKETGKIIKYLPSIGYNFISQSPHISYNTATLYASINDTHIKKAKINSIKKYMEVTFQSELDKLYRYYADLEAEIDYYNHAIQLYKLNQDLFNISIEKHENLEITPTEFINSQIKIKNEEIKLKKKYTDIIKLRNLILDIAKANPKPKLFE